jgi:hypothetical protein
MEGQLSPSGGVKPIALMVQTPPTRWGVPSTLQQL